MSEREYNRTDTESIFGSLEYWNCDIPVDSSGGEQHVGILKNFTAAILDGEKLACAGL